MARNRRKSFQERTGQRFNPQTVAKKAIAIRGGLKRQQEVIDKRGGKAKPAPADAEAATPARPSAPKVSVSDLSREEIAIAGVEGLTPQQALDRQSRRRRVNAGSVALESGFTSLPGGEARQAPRPAEPGEVSDVTQTMQFLMERGASLQEASETAARIHAPAGDLLRATQALGAQQARELRMEIAKANQLTTAKKFRGELRQKRVAITARISEVSRQLAAAQSSDFPDEEKIAKMIGEKEGLIAQGAELDSQVRQADDEVGKMEGGSGTANAESQWVKTFFDLSTLADQGDQAAAAQLEQHIRNDPRQQTPVQ